MDDKYSKQIRTILLTLLFITIFAVCKITSEFSIVIVTSIFIAIFLLPLAWGLEKLKCPSWLATIVVMLLILFVLSAGIFFLVYAINELITILPSYTGKADEFDMFILDFISKWIDVSEFNSILDFFNIDWIGIIIPSLRALSSSLLNISSKALLTILFAFFLILERGAMVKKISEISERTENPKAHVIIERMSKQVSRYIMLKIVISLLTGAIFYFICRYVKMDFALIIGVLTFIMNFIPTIGSIIITVLTILLAAIQFFPVWNPVFIVAIGTVATQNILGNIIEPRLQGNELNLSPFIILVSLSLFGYIWGIIGMFLAVPILSVIQIIFANLEDTKPIAIILSSGTSFKRKMRAKEKKESPSLFDDVFMPSEKKT